MAHFPLLAVDSLEPLQLQILVLEEVEVMSMKQVEMEAQASS